MDKKGEKNAIDFYIDGKNVYIFKLLGIGRVFRGKNAGKQLRHIDLNVFPAGLVNKKKLTQRNDSIISLT